MAARLQRVLSTKNRGKPVFLASSMLNFPLNPPTQMNTLTCQQKVLPSLIYRTRNTPNGLIFCTTATKLRPLALALRNNSLGLFRHLVDVAATDRLLSSGRFVVNYIFLSCVTNQRLTLQFAVNETTIIPSLAAPFTNGQRLFASAS